jgi:hypothetical protein
MNIPPSGAQVAGASEIWSGASAPMSPNQKMSNLFDNIDSTGAGTINQSQFAQAFKTLNPPAGFQSAGADAVWKNLDPQGTGSVSKGDFTSSMTTMMKQLRQGHHHLEGSAAGAQALTQSTGLLDALGNPKTSVSSSALGPSKTGSILNSLA